MKRNFFLNSLLVSSLLLSFVNNMNAKNTKDEKIDVSKKAITLDGADKQKTKLWFQNIDKADVYRIAVKLVKDGVFFDNIDQAIAKARKENKPLLMEFVGSNWCPACMLLIKGVFTNPEFQAYAKENLVLMLIDLPRDIKQNKKLREQNMALTEIFAVSGFPTGIMLNPKLDRKLYGYVGGFESTADYLNEISGGIDVFYNVLWERGLDIAMQKAKKAEKQILVEFVKDSSVAKTNVAIKEDKPTVAFQKNIFDKNIFKQYVKKNLILLRLNLKDDEKLAKKYNVIEPTLLLLNDNGKIVKCFMQQDVKKITLFMKKLNKK